MWGTNNFKASRHGHDTEMIPRLHYALHSVAGSIEKVITENAKKTFKKFCGKGGGKLE